MANLDITPSAVVPSPTSTTIHFQPVMIGGEAIAAGDTVCQLATDSKAYKADANDADKRDVKGIAGASGAAAGQRVDVITETPSLTIGTHGVAIGTPLFQSATPGKMCPLADLATGDLPVLIAYVASTTTIQIAVAKALVAKA